MKGWRVPEICRFYGLVVAMFWDEHPPPHFHVRYGGSWAKIEIGSGALIVGSLPGRAHSLVREWEREHREELHANWARTWNRDTPMPIEPLR